MDTEGLLSNPWGEGWYFLTEAQAKKLLSPKPLPKNGREALVQLDNQHWWVCLTYIHSQKLLRWTMRPAKGWKLVNGQAVLGGIVCDPLSRLAKEAAASY